MFLCSVLILFPALLFACSGDSPVEGGGDEPIVDEVPTAKKVILEMSDGFNLGNVFDNGLNSSSFSSIKPIIDLYKNAGMKNIRIPVTWMDRFTADNHLADDQGSINTQHARFKELVKVVDYALDQGLYVVINTHHEHWLKDNYDGSAAMDQKFENLWTGIATYFKDYDYHLIFEILNEPEGKLGEWGGDWPQPTSSGAIYYTRKVNEVGYNAVRSTGGNNKTRIIMVSVNGKGNASMIEEVYPSKTDLPADGKDKYLAIHVHNYNPWPFCGDTGSNSAWPGEDVIANSIKAVGDHSKILGAPIHYGEFGVGRQSNASERNTDIVRSYYKTLAKTALSEGMAYSVWDDRGWYGLTTKDGSGFIYNIVPTMLAK